MLTERLRAQIAERKHELLEFLRDYDQSAAFSTTPILRRSTRNPAPLSFAQERLWFLEQLEADAAVYNIYRASRLSGKLRLTALEASLNEIVRRHEILRSVIRVADGQPMQVAEPPYELKLSVVDLRAMSDIEREAHIRNRIRQAAEMPFDFSLGMFLRAELVRTGDDEHILILTTHHIVSDAWSMGILTRELWSLYEAYANDRPPPLPDLSIQYADFAAWQRNWLQGEMLDSQLSYWKKQLNEIPIPNLPTDRPRPARHSFRGARQSIALEHSLTEAINDLSHRERVTPFMTLLSGFQVLLYRYSGQEDVVVGSPIANRRRTELDSLIGFFVNTLVLRADLSGNPTFKEALARVREVCFGAYAHQDLPFEKLVEELKPERDTSRNPLFQVMFVLQNATRPISGIPGLRIEPIEMATTGSPFDLSLFLREREGKYIGYIEYSTDLFDASTIERMAGHFRTLLEGIVADPDRRISVLPILTEAERHQLLVEWNDTAADYPKDKCIHELFEAQANRTPDAIAVEFEEQRLTYSDLNIRANQLAHHLISFGVGPETLVGICVERSIEMVVGLLGILKAGGAYVPLDPSYPKARLEFMLSDAKVSVVVTHEKYLESGQRSALSSPLTYVCMDRDREVINRQSGSNVERGVTANNLAYVIYTSGSTGQPKGVAIEHRNASNLLHWARNIYTTGDLGCVLASTSICFDLSVFELFVPLSWGGKVLLVHNALCLADEAGPRKISLVNTVPSVMAAVLSAGRLPGTIRVVNLAGEPLRSELVKQIYDLGSVERVYDLYGPSETTTYSTFVFRTADGPATIGRPLSNTQVYLLDSHSQPVPIGVPGELYIGGDGVAAGYLNRPELTSEKFIQNTFADAPNCRLYRTGDIARYLPNGSLQFLGRFDTQVKLRGYRIELEEIESVLNQHPGIKDSVIVARDRDSAREESLIGYIVPKQQPVPSGVELRSYLKEKLPDYMIPSMFMPLAELPLTPNGKIDRSRLPAPENSFTDVTVSPQTEIEKLLAQIWGDVLNVEQLGVHDNFFELGGHSLLAIQIIYRIREAVEKQVELSALFDAPTIAGLAAIVEGTISGGSHELPPIRGVSRDQPLPLSMNQEHLWRLDRIIPGTHFFNMPYMYKISGNLNVDALEKAVKEIIKRHESLRTTFTEFDGHPVQVITDGANIGPTVIDHRNASLDESLEMIADLITAERLSPFDLTLGPLVRTKLLRLTNSESFLLITLHHIISDHWSMQILRRELALLYQSYLLGRPSSLPGPQIQFADYALWERRLLAGRHLNAQMNFWKQQLLSSTVSFNSRNTGTDNLRCLNMTQSIEFASGLFSAVKRLANRTNTTPFIVLLAAWSVFLEKYYGSDLRIGVQIANRSQWCLEPVIGHLVNTVIVHLHRSREFTQGAMLRHVRNAVFSAMTNGVVPFEQVARAMESEHGIHRSCLFRVLFIYKHLPEAIQPHGITFASINTAEITIEENGMYTNCDMILSFFETSTRLTGRVNYVKESFEADVANSLIQYAHAFSGEKKIL